MTSRAGPPHRAARDCSRAPPPARPCCRRGPDGHAIEAVDLVRTYRTHTGVIRRRPLEVEAVRGVSFEVRPGELFGLLGPNGAGKTTTIKMLITLLLPTSGTARVMGYDVVNETTEVRQRIGYVFGGDRGLYDRVSALDNLRYFAELYGVDPADQKQRHRGAARDGGADRAREGEGRGLQPRACGSGCTSPAACSTTPRSSSWTSRRSALTRSARASCGRRSSRWSTPARPCC